jgi:hypothetical protein
MEILITDLMDIEKKKKPTNINPKFKDHTLTWTLVIRSLTKEFTCHTSSYYGKKFL